MKTESLYLGGAQQIGALSRINKGKVRDIYQLDEERLLFVTSDRVSAFDVVMNQGVPDKGRVLTAITAWWFEQTKDLCPNHILSTKVEDIPGLDPESQETLRGRVLIVRKTIPTVVEWVVRGYIAGSGWKEYKKQQTVCGIPLPAGLEFCQRLPQPLLTPTTKDDLHDEAISLERARELVGPKVFDRAHSVSLALFARGTETLKRLDIRLADTKFEFGCLPSGELILIDEALTPDSSRFWPSDDYEVGRNQKSYDKQILRDYLETLDWNKEAPAPQLPGELIDRISGRYLEICEKITGAPPEGVKL